MTRTVTGMMAMRMGSNISPISAQSSITPAAAGTKSSGKIPVRNTPEVQGQQQQHKPVHTGRNRQRQYGMTYFPQKAKREDTRKLKQIIRKKSPLSNS